MTSMKSGFRNSRTALRYAVVVLLFSAKLACSALNNADIGDGDPELRILHSRESDVTIFRADTVFHRTGPLHLSELEDREERDGGTDEPVWKRHTAPPQTRGRGLAFK